MKNREPDFGCFANQREWPLGAGLYKKQSARSAVALRAAYYYYTPSAAFFEQEVAMGYPGYFMEPRRPRRGSLVNRSGGAAAPTNRVSSVIILSVKYSDYGVSTSVGASPPVSRLFKSKTALFPVGAKVTIFGAA